VAIRQISKEKKRFSNRNFQLRNVGEKHVERGGNKKGREKSTGEVSRSQITHRDLNQCRKIKIEPRKEVDALKGGKGIPTICLFLFEVLSSLKNCIEAGRQYAKFLKGKGSLKEGGGMWKMGRGDLRQGGGDKTG